MRYETRDKVYIDSINGVYNKIIDSDTILYEVSFNDGSAVLLSGNKSCIPFLGMITPDEDFAFSSVLENVDNPEVVNCFIDTYCEQIKYCFDSRASSLLEQNEWDKLLQYDTSYYNNLERSKVGPLITTKWGQSRSNQDMNDQHEDDDVIYKDEVELLPSNANPAHISIYPNPANGNITIELTADCHTIEIYDSFGRMMMSQQVTESLSHQVVDVDISKYPSGLYLVVVKDDNNRYYKRIVKN